MEPYDLVINNGIILDPASRFEGRLNLGIRDGKLATLSTDRLEGFQEIDASGQAIAPGFIDIHCHPDGIPEDGVILAQQGVTTALGGNCGSLFHLGKEEFEKLFFETKGETYDLLQYKGDFGSFLSGIDEKGFPINLGMLAGDWFLRLKVGANDKNKPATPEQVKNLVTLADEAMRQGAFGISFGLAYAPGIAADELEALFDVAARFDGIAAVHQRYGGWDVPGFTKGALAGEIELIEAARKTGCRLQLSHIGSHIAYASKPYDRFLLSGLYLVEKARAEGVDVMADTFPFAGMGGSIIDKETEMIFSPQFKRIMGMEAEEYAYIPEGPYQGEKLTFALYSKLKEEAPNTAVTFRRFIPQDLLWRTILTSWVMVCSDAAFGWIRPAQPLVLGHMVRDLGMLTWMEALEKMTILPALRLGLKNKGRIMAGADADLVIFDKRKIKGSLKAITPFDYDPDEKDAEPQKPVEGISHVIVNGVVAVKDNVYQQVNPGKALRHQPWL